MGAAGSRTAAALLAAGVGAAAGLGVALAGGGAAWIVAATAAAAAVSAVAIGAHRRSRARLARRWVVVFAAVPLVAGLALAARGDWLGAALNLGAVALAAVLVAVESAMRR